MNTATVVPAALRDLWQQRARLLASNVATDGREHREIAHAAALIRQDYHDRFLIELIQNANDQALLGGIFDSTVVVVRSEGLLAVSNGGQAVTSRNLERLSSLADSDKTGLLVGNKGVGFKAVYQVTDAPEIFSAPQGSSASLSVCSDFGVGIALDQHPFQQTALVAAVEEYIRGFFSDNAGLASLVSARGFEDPVDAVRKEFGSVAGFKFPLARDRHDLIERVSVLAIPEVHQQVMRTLVVLPLRDERAGHDVECAIDRLVGSNDVEPAQAELAVLFLSGVATIVVLDHVRNRRWTFSRTITPADGPVHQSTVSVIESEVVQRVTRFWVLRRDVLDCAAPVAAERRRVIEDALREFSLEAWTANDPLPVTLALPMPDGCRATLGRPGRFCLGLPTEQSTGLPVHVDGRFFATISRTGLDFALGYNELLLDVAAELFGDLLAHLRLSSTLDDRRAATLALERTDGALSNKVFAPAGIADGEVVLAWGGHRYVSRNNCRLPGADERTLLVFLRDSLTDRLDLFSQLPEEGLLTDASNMLQSIGLPALGTTPHPWLDHGSGGLSAIELTARHHRADGPDYWEHFVPALLACFDAPLLEDHSWLPVGEIDLAAPSQRVFLPAPVDTQGDEEEVANVPPRVAAMIRLVDGGAMRLREDGRALTKLALGLSEARLVRRPRKTELLEEALFPALEKSSATDSELALELFAQAVSWIASMRDASRKKLDCKQARVPVTSPATGEISWVAAWRSYIGDGWGLPAEHEHLLGKAYPGRRLPSFGVLRDRFDLRLDETASWRAAVEVMGVRGVPRVLTYKTRSAPLQSHSGRLHVVGKPALGHQMLDAIYQEYIQFLANTFSTSWSQRFPHDVEDVYWVDGLEEQDRRRHVVDLMLMNPAAFMQNTAVDLRRVGGFFGVTVPAMWVFALRSLDWPVFPGERGVGRESVRVSVGHLWRLPEGARRAGYAQVINVVPHAFAGASVLLNTLGIPSIEDAPLGRLFAALNELAGRLEEERLHTRREALSLANELYARIDERLAGERLERVPPNARFPFLRDRRLEAVDPEDQSLILIFDDEPARARHMVGLDRAFRVPIARDQTMDRLHALFARSWGETRVLRTSTSKVELSFSPAGGTEESFLSWLQREFPHTEVASELAALLTLGGERSVRAEPVSRNWRNFEKLTIVFGVFRESSVVSFYDRPLDKLLLSSSLTKCDVVAMTWELAGARSRDTWAGYARALQDSSTRTFLHDREIGDVEIIDVADAAGLHRATSVDGLAPALHAARSHLFPGSTLEDAVTWFSGVGDRPEDVVRELGRPDLAAVLVAALGKRPPDGELQVVRYLGVPWTLWQNAVLRRDGERYVFTESVQRYRQVREHLVAVAKEIGARDAAVDLQSLGIALAKVLNLPVPDDVQFLPPDVANADAAAWRDVRSPLASFEAVAQALEELPAPPWEPDPPIPRDATRRGVRLFREVAASTRGIEATTSVNAVVGVAVRLAALFGEQVDPALVLSHQSLIARMDGDWAHVYAALLMLRPLLDIHSPETVKKLSSAHAFRDPSTVGTLMARLPELPRTKPEAPQLTQSVLGIELLATAVRADLASGSGGVLGAKLAEAAARGLDPSVLAGERIVLPASLPPGKRGPGGGAGGGTSRPQRELDLIGDIGEAFVHEWLSSVLGVDYGPDCWVSKARERYGLPPSGSDGLGYDFKVPDPNGRLFGTPAATFFVEVKSTSTEGDGPFPMSSAEWDQARRCHESGNGTMYVIVRVFAADSSPRIGDVVIDPFAAHRRGEVRLAERDLWVTVSSRKPVEAP